MTENPFQFLVLSYLFGSIPTSYILGKVFFGIDLRTVGSGNLGATNALRNFGKITGLAVLVVDIAKGWVPIWYFSRLLENQTNLSWIMACGFATILGHIYSCWVNFKGGKGVATSCGVFLAITPLAAVSALAVWLLIFLFNKTASVASLVSSICFPIAIYLDPNTKDPALLWFSIVLSVLIIWTHRTNVARIIEGTEGSAL